MMIWITLTYLLGLFTDTSNERPELHINLIAQELLENAHHVIRKSVTTVDVKSASTYTLHVHETVTVFNVQSLYTDLYVFYDQHSKARILSAEIYDATGKLIRKVKREEIQDMAAIDGGTIYSDSRVLSLNMHGGQLPYTVEYVYQVDFTATMGYAPWTQSFHEAIESAEFHLVQPAGMRIAHRVLGEGIEQSPEEEGGRRVWTMQQRKAVPAEENMPPRLTLLPSLLLAPEEFVVDEYQGSMKDWKSYGMFMHKINAGREQLSQAMQHTVKRLVDAVPDEKSQIDVLYRYLQDNMRYVSVQLGIGGWQAFDAEYVERNKYGDCKALTYFLKGMLKEAGIEAYPVLIAGDKPSFFLDDFVTQWYFNHMILYIPSADMWIECTSKDAPTGYLGEWTADRDVLLITPDGGVKSRTPGDGMAGKIVTADELQSDSSGWHLSGSRTYSQQRHEYYRYLVSSSQTADQEKFFREQCPLTISRMRKLQYEVVADSPDGRCAYELDLKQFGSASGPRLFLPVNPLYRSTASCYPATRVHPLYDDLALTEENALMIRIPEGYTVESLPSTKSHADERFGTYHLEVEQTGNMIQVRRTYVKPPLHLSTDALKDLCAFTKLIETADKASVVLKKSP